MAKAGSDQMLTTWLSCGKNQLALNPLLFQHLEEKKALCKMFISSPPLWAGIHVSVRNQFQQETQ